MGLILDSSLQVAAERQGKNARQMLAAIVQRKIDPVPHHCDVLSRGRFFQL
jgi:hypothetical protein